jgi:hypothetical protein
VSYGSLREDIKAHRLSSSVILSCNKVARDRNENWHSLLVKWQTKNFSAVAKCTLSLWNKKGEKLRVEHASGEKLAIFSKKNNSKLEYTKVHVTDFAE